MVVDSSPIIAWIRAEREADAIMNAIVNAPSLFMSAFNLGLRVLPFDTNQAAVAFDAYLRFGKGSGHAAQLNLGDCAAYALARSLDLPLLFKGNDFIHTDVSPAL